MEPCVPLSAYLLLLNTTVRGRENCTREPAIGVKLEASWHDLLDVLDLYHNDTVEVIVAEVGRIVEQAGGLGHCPSAPMLAVVVVVCAVVVHLAYVSACWLTWRRRRAHQGEPV